MDKSLSSQKELSEGIIHTSEMKELNFEGEPMWKSKDSGTGGVINNKKVLVWRPQCSSRDKAQYSLASVAAEYKMIPHKNATSVTCHEGFVSKRPSHGLHSHPLFSIYLIIVAPEEKNNTFENITSIGCHAAYV